MPQTNMPQDLAGISQVLLTRTRELIKHSSNLPTFELYKNLLLLLARKEKTWLTYAFLNLELEDPLTRHRINYHTFNKILLQHDGREERLTAWEIIQQLDKVADRFGETGKDFKRHKKSRRQYSDREMIETVALNAVRFQTGNCEECCAVVSACGLEYSWLSLQPLYLHQIAISNASALFPVAVGDDEHVLMLLTLEAEDDIDLEDIETWGKEAQLIDAWRNEIVSVQSLLTGKPANTVLGRHIQKASKKGYLSTVYSIEVSSGHSKHWKTGANRKNYHFLTAAAPPITMPRKPLKFVSSTAQNPKVIAELCLFRSATLVPYSNTLETQSYELYKRFLIKLARNPEHWITKQLKNYNLYHPDVRQRINDNPNTAIALEYEGQLTDFTIIELIVELNKIERKENKQNDEINNDRELYKQARALVGPSTEGDTTYHYRFYQAFNTMKMFRDVQREKEKFDAEENLPVTEDRNIVETTALQACQFQAGNTEEIVNVITVLLMEYHVDSNEPLYVCQIAGEGQGAESIFMIITHNNDIDVGNVRTWGKEAIIIDVRKQEVVCLADIFSKKAAACESRIWKFIKESLRFRESLFIMDSYEVGSGHSEEWDDNKATRDIKLWTYPIPHWNDKPPVPFVNNPLAALADDLKRIRLG